MLEDRVSLNALKGMLKDRVSPDALTKALGNSWRTPDTLFMASLEIIVLFLLT